MGSMRFYEHAQNLLGGMKKEVGNYKLRGKRDVIIVKYYIKNCVKLYYTVILPRYYLML